MEELIAGCPQPLRRDGRYAFDQQPMVAYWNLACLGGALTPLAPTEALTEVLNTYPKVFNEGLDRRLREKLGLARTLDGDTDLWSGALNLLAEQKVDYTTFFRSLGDFDPRSGTDNLAARGLFACPAGFDAWAEQYRARLDSESAAAGERKARMDRVNPRYVLRNYLAQQAISRAEEVREFGEIDRLLDLLRDPFTDRPGMEEYARPAPWGKHLTVSCSS